MGTTFFSSVIRKSILKNPPDYYLLKSEFGNGDIILREINN
jgi:hypothetical protein